MIRTTAPWGRMACMASAVPGRKCTTPSTSLVGALMDRGTFDTGELATKVSDPSTEIRAGDRGLVAPSTLAEMRSSSRSSSKAGVSLGATLTVSLATPFQTQADAADALHHVPPRIAKMSAVRNIR
jgi:hypothetical protein